MSNKIVTAILFVILALSLALQLKVRQEQADKANEIVRLLQRDGTTPCVDGLKGSVE